MRSQNHLALPERHEDRIGKEHIDRANDILDAMHEEGFDLNWISAYDVVRCESKNSYPKTGNGIIAFPSEETRMIWEGEILGQISDGAWENYWVDEANGTFHDDWKDYFAMDTKVDESLDEPELRDGARLPASLEYVDELTRYDPQPARMIFFARYVGDEEFDMDDLLEFLGGLERL